MHKNGFIFAYEVIRLVLVEIFPKQFEPSVKGQNPPEKKHRLTSIYTYGGFLGHHADQ